MLRALLGVRRLERRVDECGREVLRLLREQGEYEAIVSTELEALNVKIADECAKLREQLAYLEREIADLSITNAELELRMVGLREGVSCG